MVEQKTHGSWPLLWQIVAGLASAWASIVGLFIKEWTGYSSPGQALLLLYWSIPVLSLPVFALSFLSLAVARALSWVLVGGGIIAVFVVGLHTSILDYQCSFFQLIGVLLKVLVSSPYLWGLLIAAVSLQLKPEKT